ncbi:efflux RND transporter periplasmic adaptor subunit [Natronospora cellulosivora (SeqCode)]
MDKGPIVREKPKRKKNGNNMNRKIFVFLLVSLLVLIAVPMYFLSGFQDEDFILRSFRYAEVDTRTFTRNLRVRGILVPEDKAKIRSEVNGRISELYFQAGDDVEEGQVILTINAPELEEKILEAREIVNRAKSNLREVEITQEMSKREEKIELLELESRKETARSDLKIKEILFELGTISQKELEDALKTLASLTVSLENKHRTIELTEERYRFELIDAKDKLDQAIENHENLLEKQDNTRVKAPISGRIMKIAVRDNQAVVPNDLLVEIADLESSIVELELAEEDAFFISRGREANVEISGQRYPAYVSYISPQIRSTNDGDFVEVKLSLEELPANIRANSRASVAFVLARRENIKYLPRGNYLTSGQYNFVYIIEGEEAIRKSNISFGQHDGNFIEVISGLEKGDKVIIDSYEDFKDKASIDINLEGGRKYE